jgi:hypothetical protein
MGTAPPTRRRTVGPTVDQAQPSSRSTVPRGTSNLRALQMDFALTLQALGTNRSTSTLASTAQPLDSNHVDTELHSDLLSHTGGIFPQPAFCTDDHYSKQQDGRRACLKVAGVGHQSSHGHQPLRKLNVTARRQAEGSGKA